LDAIWGEALEAFSNKLLDTLKRRLWRKQAINARSKIRSSYFPGMTGIEIIVGIGLGFTAYVLLRALMMGFFTVAPNERAVLTSFGRAQRIGTATTLDTPLADDLPELDRERYSYPQLQVIGPGGPYFRWPWQKVHKVNVAISTASIAFDPETPEANQGGSVLEAVTQDQLNIGVTGQIRFSASESNLYAYLFGVKKPIAHVMGYLVSILRERIANFKAPRQDAEAFSEDLRLEGISINDLRKNVNLLNEQMDRECRSSAARYGIVLDASLITGIDPPPPDRKRPCGNQHGTQRSVVRSERGAGARGPAHRGVQARRGNPNNERRGGG
jgi:regulator of protease activity HflC (stomatin/prohibitin superfamily)